jgi:hypothetical protein
MRRASRLRRSLSSGSRGLRGCWEDRSFRTEPGSLARLASQVVGTSLLPPSPSPLPAWRSRASRSSRCRHLAMSAGGLPGLRSRPELLLPPGKSARFVVGLPRRSRNRAASFLSWDSCGGRERIAAPRHPSPLHRRHASESTPATLAGRFGAEGATLAARSVLVVSHHLDGFLLQSARGLVASRCRSWGSPRFRRDRLVSEPIVAFPATYFAPLEGCSPRVAAPRHRGRCLLAVFTASRPCSTFGSGTHAIGCPTTCALSFLGFVPPPRSFRTATGSLPPSVMLRTAPEPAEASSSRRPKPPGHRASRRSEPGDGLRTTEVVRRERSEDFTGEGEVANASNRAASPRSEDHERPIRSESLQGFASSRSRSSPSGVPGVCPEPKSRHHCR